MLIDSELLPGDCVRAVESLAEAFDARSIRYALIGGLAFVIRGRPRFTQDVDILLEVPQIVLPVVLADLIERGFSLDTTLVIIETLLTANRDEIDVDLIRREWAPFAATEVDRTSWLESAIARRVVRRE